MPMPAAATIEVADFTDLVDGPELVDETELAEETLASQGHSGDADPFDAALRELEVVLMDEAFNRFVDDFSLKHCHEFEQGDENKLVYTTLHNEFSAMVESHIEERLGASLASFDMASFCSILSERAKQETGLPLPLEMLYSMTDFDAFKELMLSAKTGIAATSPEPTRHLGMQLLATHTCHLPGHAGAAVEGVGGALCVSGDRLQLVNDASAIGDEDESVNGGVERPDMGSCLSISGLSIQGNGA